jgi:hypothetical protein
VHRIHSQQLAGDRDTTPEAKWRLELDSLLDRDIKRLKRRADGEDSTASLKARVRIAMLRHLRSRAIADSQGTRASRVAWWHRHLGVIDAWIDDTDGQAVSSAISSMELTSAESPLLGGSEIVEAIRLHGPSQSDRLCEEMLDLLLCAGARPDVRRSVRHALRTMRDAGGDSLLLLELFTAIRMASASMAIPVRSGTLHLRSAVQILDKRIVEMLMSLEQQAEWLVDCDDPSLNPAAHAVLSHIRQASTQRGVFARCSSEVWDSDDNETKTQLMVAAQRVEANDDDDAMHAQLVIVADRAAPVPRVYQALDVIGWPEDPLDRLLWNPAKGGQLLAAMESVRYLAARGDWEAWQEQLEFVHSYVGTDWRSGEHAE